MPATGSGPELSASKGVWPVHREVDGYGAVASREGGRASDELTCSVSRSSCASSVVFSSSRRLRSASSSSTFNLQGEQTVTGGHYSMASGPSRDSRARTRSPSPRAWRPDFPGAAREAP